MTRLLARAALAAATLTVPGIADAALLRYDIAGTVPGKFTATFQLDTTRQPSIVLTDSVRYNGVPITYTLPNSTAPITENAQFDGVTFSATRNQGGLFYGFLDAAANYNNRIQLFGAQLFTGTTAAPGFLTGTFDLSDIPPNGASLQPNYRVTVTDLSAAVPEPATWGLMILGFAGVGASARRRRRTRVGVPA